MSDLLYINVLKCMGWHTERFQNLSRHTVSKRLPTPALKYTSAFLSLLFTKASITCCNN